MRSEEIARQLGAAQNELEEDQIWAMLNKWTEPGVPVLCRDALSMKLLGLGIPGNIGDVQRMPVTVDSLSFADIRLGRIQRRTYLEALHGGEAITLGVAAERVVELARNAVAARHEEESAMATIDATKDLPGEAPLWWRMFHAAAWAASRCGVTISIIPHGVLVKHHRKSEIVRWEQVELGVLERAIDRVSSVPEPAF